MKNPAMKKPSSVSSAFFAPHALSGFVLCLFGVVFLGIGFPQEASGQWSIVASSDTSPTQDNRLNSVACVSSSDCWAVGSSFDGTNYHTLIERWTGAQGTKWNIVTSPNTSSTEDNVLSDVTCSSSTDCWAVGYYLSSGFLYQTLIERWNGTSWSIVTSPNSSTGQPSFLNSVTCTSGSNCWAVGAGANSSGIYLTLIERWNGTAWAIVSSPNATTVSVNLLNGVTCTSSSDCWAVGDYNNGIPPVIGFFQTLIERWDGTSWTIVSSPNASTDDFLNGVACTALSRSVSECWAVGLYHTTTNGQTLIEKWNGTSWSIVTSPSGTELQDVACTAASNCWAVGDYYNGTNIQTLTQQWNGTSWSTVSSPNISASDNFLNGVACVSASDCWAAGREKIAPQPFQPLHTLMEHHQ